MTFADDSILVFLDTTPSGGLAKSAAELLGAAASVGTPVAVIVGDAALATDAAALGAASVLVAAPGDGLGAAAVDALTAAADQVRPDAILVAHSVEGREVAGRYAARTRSGLAVDAVGVSRDAEGVIAHHSVYGGAYNVDAAVTWGAPVITIRQGSVDARADAVAGVEAEPLEVRPSNRRAATVVSVDEAVVSSTRPELRGAAKVVSGGRGLGSGEKFALVSSSPTRWAPRSAHRVPRSTPATCRTRTRSVRPGCRWHRSCMWRWASRARSSTRPACRPRRRSWRSTRMRMPGSSRSRTSVSSAICSRWCRS